MCIYVLPHAPVALLLQHNNLALLRSPLLPPSAHRSSTTAEWTASKMTFTRTSSSLTACLADSPTQADPSLFNLFGCPIPFSTSKPGPERGRTRRVPKRAGLWIPPRSEATRLSRFRQGRSGMGFRFVEGWLLGRNSPGRVHSPRRPARPQVAQP